LNIQFIRNPHFWATVFIVLILTSIYYAHMGIFSFINLRWEWLWQLTIFEFKYNLHGSLFCIPFIYVAVIFWWRGILITWLFSMALMMPRIRYLTPDTPSFMANIVFLLIPLLVVLILALLRNWRVTVRKAAEHREEEHKAYIGQIIKAQENERRRISREIHDDTTQRLWILANTTQSIITDELRDSLPQTASKLVAIKDEILQISGEAKRLSLALRPGILDDLGLIPAITGQIDQLNSEHSIEAKLFVEGIERQLTQEISIHLFRIAQEALNNTKRHSGATKLTLRLAFHPETVKMTIWDNGKGFSRKGIRKLSNENKLGIIGIQERVRLLDGILKIDSSRSKGTKLSVEFSDSYSNSEDNQH
jgi:signal transduction histidine kinase